MKEIIEAAMQSTDALMSLIALGVVFVIIPLVLFCKLIVKLYHKFVRARTIRRIGYPPRYCDGDGDPIETEHEEEVHEYKL